VAYPLGQRGVVRPLVVGDDCSLFELSDVAFDPPAQPLDTGLPLGALLFLGGGETPGALLGLVEIIRQELGHLTPRLVLHRVDVGLEEIAVVDPFVARVFLEVFLDE
jgi:hypothetical protein